MTQHEIEAQVIGDDIIRPLSRAQRILLASHLLLQYLRRRGIVIEHAVLIEFSCRVERWCVDAQLQERA